MKKEKNLAAGKSNITTFLSSHNIKLVRNISHNKDKIKLKKKILVKQRVFVPNENK
jgi:hypothetical protein